MMSSLSTSLNGSRAAAGACFHRLPVRRLRVACSFRFFTKLDSYNPLYNKYEIKRPSVAATVAAPNVLERASTRETGRVGFQGVHHVALLVKDLKTSLQFYQGVLGLEVNPDRPHHKLPYPGAWLWIGTEMIHLMELPNPDTLDGRPEHGGRDRHFCIGVDSIKPLTEKLDAAGIKYTMSMSGRPAVFFRDPDANCLEVVELEPWR